MKNRTNARNYFTLSTNQDTRGTNFISYYQGLSYLKLGKTEQAKQIFNSMVADASKQIEVSRGAENDFFAKFGEQEAENVRLSNAYLLKGLGNKGLGDVAQATSNLKKAVELSAANLYAKVELEHL
jgi:tetratricopeptide (TPR) repeat protein